MILNSTTRCFRIVGLGKKGIMLLLILINLAGKGNVFNGASGPILDHGTGTYNINKGINKGGKLFIGRVWDYDIAYHNCNYDFSFDPSGWAYQLHTGDYPIPTWWVKLLYCRRNDLGRNILLQSTTFCFKLKEPADVSLSIADLVGKEVARYMNMNVPLDESLIFLKRTRCAREFIYINCRSATY